MPSLLSAHDVDPLSVRLFPVPSPRLGALPAEVWSSRKAVIDRLVADAPEPVRSLGREYRAALDAYERDARTPGGIFVEIQNTTLFATLGQKAS